MRERMREREREREREWKRGLRHTGVYDYFHLNTTGLKKSLYPGYVIING